MSNTKPNDDFVMPSVFGFKPPDAILVPDMPMSVRNNCQVGQWLIGDDAYGSKCSMTILKFAKFFGNLGQTKQVQWGQLWFVAESGDLPKGVLMVTYIKSRGLQNFSNLIASVQSRGIEPASGIFSTEFVKHTGQGPDDSGVVKPRNYFSLKWDWKERSKEDYSILKQGAAVLANPDNMSRLVDLDGTRQMISIDGMSSERLARLLQNENPDDAIGQLPDAQLNALPASPAS